MRRLERLMSPRALAPVLLFVGLFVLPLGGLAWFTTPGFMNPMGYEHPWYELAVPVLGLLGILIGNVLIRRINSDPEAGERSWRYRDF